VADRLGRKDVFELEKLATAFYVTTQHPPHAGRDDRAAKIHELKPHVPLE
jgi:hypothetical protein